MFTGAITRRPGRSVANGITSSPELGKPNYDLAVQQHERYVHALERCGLSVDVLEPLEEFPDSCFVEDTAIITEKCVVLTNPGAPERREETAYICAALRKRFPTRAFEAIVSSGTLEGGDVLRVGDHFYIGISARTNEAGGMQLAGIMREYGYTSNLVPVKKVLHLKTSISYLDNGYILVAGEFLDWSDFNNMKDIKIDVHDSYAVNCLWINGRVLVPAGYGKVKSRIEGLGYEVIEVDTSEFRKIDGGLTCLSLRF